MVAAPSGAGKTSLVSALVDKLDAIRVSISYTTRPKRADEVDGVNYHFISEADYQEMLLQDAFLECATVFGYHYGTGKRWVCQQLARGMDVVLEIDWQGARQIRKLFPLAVSIFILPPSLEVLQHRLQKRGQDEDKVIESRMAQSQSELAHYAEFDYLIVNRVFEEALDALQHVVLAERLRYKEQEIEQHKLLEELLRNK